MPFPLSTLLLERSEPIDSRIIRKADEALRAPLLNVTQKPSPPPGGDLRDYSSYGPYWWPDPDQPDGLPYVRRDGEVNQETRIGNAPDLETMAERVHVLSMAWAATSELRYATAAAAQLRAWFLDEKTGMRPHLQFAQAIPGLCSGRGIGIIESEAFVHLPDDSALLLESGAWSQAEQIALKKWFTQYLSWLLCSEYGRDEAREHNNHGTWFDAQAMLFAWFCDRADIAQHLLQYSFLNRMEKQLAADGSQPHELARTLSWNYSIFNLQAILTACLVGQQVGIDLARWQGTQGQTLAKTLEFLLDRAPEASLPWTWPQIKPRDRHDSRMQTFASLLSRARLALHENVALVTRLNALLAK